MKHSLIARCLLGVFALVISVAAIAGPDTESFGPGQAIADELRSHTGADLAFVPAGVLKANAKGELSHYLLFPTDEISVVKLSGRQVKDALERSVSLVPMSNPGFLQISGLDVTYSASASTNSRVTSVLANGAALENDRTYTVAMPGNLARGGLGYFSIWDKKAITKAAAAETLDSLLHGKTGSVDAPRWHQAR